MAEIVQPSGEMFDASALRSFIDRRSTRLQLNPPWTNFFTHVFEICFANQSSGTTANRPTTYLWVGRIYFDTTLGKPVWLKSVSPSVWVDAAGTSV